MAKKLDLAGNNRVPQLCEDRERIKNRIATLERELKEINDDLKEIMNGATVATLPGWWLEERSYHRSEYKVRAQTIKSLIVKRTVDDDE